LTEVILGKGRLTVLTGTGISAESGIFTFRGPEVFWTIGSIAFHPQVMAAFAMVCRHPDAVWEWYLYRLGLFKKARPNAGHRTLASIPATSAIVLVYSALETAKRTRLLITAGTAGATTLPNQIVKRVLSNGGLMFDSNTADNPFAGPAMQSDRGIFIRHASSEALVSLRRTIASVTSNL